VTNGAQFRKIALSLEGTTSAPHFDRTAFKVKRTYATLAPHGRTANFKFTPDEQELKCRVAPDALSAIPNAWGSARLDERQSRQVNGRRAEAALEMAWRHAVPASRKRPRR
jgi:hypothetical protein